MQRADLHKGVGSLFLADPEAERTRYFFPTGRKIGADWEIPRIFCTFESYPHRKCVQRSRLAAATGAQQSGRTRNKRETEMKRLGLMLWLIGSLLGAGSVLRAELPQCVFQNYSTRDGLSHNHIADIYTDSRGFLWICTWYGVSRFDGYTFQNFGVRPDDYTVLSHHRFLTVSEDAAGHLWFTTYNNRIYRFNRYTEQFEDVMARVEGFGGRPYRVTHALHDAAGATWVALQEGELLCFRSPEGDAPAEVAARFDAIDLEGDVSALRIDARGSTWIATTGGGLFQVDADDRRRLHAVCRLTQPVFAFAEEHDRIYALTSQEVVACGPTGSEAVRIEGAAGGLRNGGFTAIAADTTHRRLYVGDRAGRLYRLADNTLQPIVPRAGASAARIRDLVADSHGTLWITTTEAGITRYDPQRNDCKHFEQKPYTVSYNIDTLARVTESGDRVWIKMNRYGFGCYDRANDRVEPFYNDPEQPDCQMTNAVVRFDVRDDVVWLSTYYERGLRKALLLHPPTDLITIASERPQALAGNIRALMCDRHGRTWVGTRDGELFCFGADWEKPLYTPAQGDLGMIYAIKEDRAGHIWVGTKGRGLYRLTPDASGGYAIDHYQHADDDPYSLNNDQIYAIEEDDGGRIWIATFGGGINLLESAQSRRFIHAGNRLEHYPDEAGRVRWLTFDEPGRMVAATAEGLLLFDPGEDPREMRFRLVQRSPDPATSLGSNDIIQTLRDTKGRLWLATYGGGLNCIERYDAQGQPSFRRYDMSRGLPSNICMALTEDRQGDLWIATPNAVTRFHPEEELFFNYPLYGETRNADFSEATAVTTATGEVLFGNGRHIYSFDPEQLRDRRTDYQLRFTALDVANSAVTAGPDQPIGEAMAEAKQIVLPYDYANFRIQFASLNFGIQHAVRYMYRLEGYDHTWNLSGTVNRAAYSNVPPGDYRLVVKAFFDNPSEADEGIAVAVRIRPPWWLTWWAKLIGTLLVLAIAAVALRMALSVLRIRRQAMLEQDASDMKLRFFTNISHELRTPLTLILGGIEDVQKHDRLSARGNSSLTLAHRNAKRMLSLINQLLDFRKIVREKMELKISRIDLVPLVEDALDNFREMASGRDIRLFFSVSQRSIPVWVDPERIESVLYNLLSNAVKFTPDGGRIETILTLQEADECVLLTVRDTGIGIPKEKLTTIFDRFVQASPAVDPAMKGSGIGLALCREIVTLHHGTISVESRPGEGSTFTVRLRTGNAHFGMEQIDFAAGSNYLVSDLTAEKSARRTDVQPPADARKILLVEDNSELRIFMYNRLIESYYVIEAEDGEAALEKIGSELPDIVVTDLMMPRMDGIELTQRIRSDFATSHLPIVMLTARHSPDDRVKAMEYGADSYITKPFDLELLLACIDNLLTQRRKLFEKYSSQSARNKVAELDVGEVVVTDRDEEFMKRVMSWLSENIENSELTINQLAAHVGLGRTTMYNKLKGLTGKSPVELIKEYRLTKAKLLLHTGQFSVSEVAYKTGFSDPGYFSRCFHEQYGISPAEYLKSHDLKQKPRHKTNENHKPNQS